MALKKCKECGGRVSSRANACPHCGAPRKQDGTAGAGCIGLIVIAAVVYFGWQTQTPAGRSSSRTPSSGETRSSPSIPSDVSYEIIQTDVIPGIKRSLDVRLSRKVDRASLRAIAQELKKRDSSRYQRTFILYYLPGMEVGAGAWASTHFNPALDVRILGISAEDEKALREEPIPLGWEVLGRWLDEVAGSRITMFRQDGNLFVEYKFQDGSSWRRELRETQSNRGLRFDEVNADDEYLIINRAGDLELWDQQGLIRVAKSMD